MLIMSMTRKEFLACTCIAGGSALLPAAMAQAEERRAGDKNSGWFKYSLNTGTIRGQKLGLAEEIETAVQAGYDGIEPWIETIRSYAEAGGALTDIRKRCEDSGLKVCSAIGFAQWIVNDDQKRMQGVEQLKRDMELLAQIGGTHIAAPPSGASSREAELNLDQAAERYRHILEVGRDCGVIPQIETWGSSANLSHVAEALYIAARAGHPDACVLSDVYHMYKGGSAPAVMKLLGRNAVHCFHMNDYPADPPRERIGDADRIWPGDGIAPIKEILAYLAGNHCRVFLSLELFNKEYWKMDALEAARIGLAKMKQVVQTDGV